MENPQVAQIFEEVADLLEIQSENPFRIRAYRRAAQVVSDLGERVADIVHDPDRRLDDYPGIGKDLAGKIREIVDTGELSLRSELAAKVPPGLRALLSLPGLGPKRASTLYKNLGIASLDELRKAAESHRIKALKGFGEKTEQAIIKSLQQLKQTGKRILWSEAKVYAEALTNHLRGASGVGQLEVAGSYRRRKETVGDLDIVVACKSTSQVMDRLASFEEVAEVLAHGGTRMTVRLKTGLQVDLRVVPDVSFGAALQYFTGSKAHSIHIRRRAQDRGLKVNEYGVFRGSRRIAGKTEVEVYRAIGLPWIPPELREDRGEVELAEAPQLPDLVRPEDIKGDLHVHTTDTDGRASLEDMVLAAKRRGYSYVAITDHSRRVTMARGLDARLLRQQWKRIDRLAKRNPGITILKGVELDILEDGSLDLPDSVLQEADWVVASIHYGQNQSPERITRRLLNAIENPHVAAIGHPTGRLIGKRPGYQFDLQAVFTAAAETGCLMEINAQPVRLDLDEVAIAEAKKKGVQFVVSTDAHSVEELGFMEFGINQARRAGLEKLDIVNTRPLQAFRKLLRGARPAKRSGSMAKVTV
ncbi:MAG TPA: DNA polymerase/3'-5' exonuclease PolX [Planctomycetaceae bacterium]|nr:DNA polymerase/3'-5' exonuclease PolX [Planctomycetaceae bacterium]